VEVVQVTDQVEDFGDDEMAEVKREDWGDPADVPVTAEELLDGGPTRSGGAVTTTGSGRAGPARRARPVPPRGGKVAPTTTGDATSGGMGPRGGGSTSDATTGAESTTGTGRPPKR
jgi:hypothetical protein